jgi:murein DD-endopeptidase MepM/ murein hydrolase activator NlpD
VADGRHRRDKNTSRRAVTIRQRRRYRVATDVAAGSPIAVVGAAAVTVAVVGGLNVAEANTAGDTGFRAAGGVSVQAADLDRQLGELRRAEQERQVRASRERARKAMEELRRRKAMEESRRRKVMEELRRREAAKRKRIAEAQQKARETERRRHEAAPRARSTGAYALPVANYRLTAGFGESGSRWSSSHTGQDFAAPSGTAVRAVSGGVVTSAEWAGAYGWRVIIRHPDGTETWYCHLSSFVVRGGSVVAGQVIGRVGSTGNSTGPHLHLEVRVNDVPIDPMPWLRRHGLNP